MAAGREPKQSLELFDTCQGLLLPVGSVPINIFHILRQEKSDAIKHPVGWLSLPEAARAVLVSSLPCPVCVPLPGHLEVSGANLGSGGVCAQLRAKSSAGRFYLGVQPMSASNFVAQISNLGAQAP